MLKFLLSSLHFKWKAISRFMKVCNLYGDSVSRWPLEIQPPPESSREMRTKRRFFCVRRSTKPHHESASESCVSVSHKARKPPPTKERGLFVLLNGSDVTRNGPIASWKTFQSVIAGTRSSRPGIKSENVAV